MSSIGALNTAVTGMQAARTQMGVSASNVANARSEAATSTGPDADGFQPRRTVREAQPGGGVRAATQAVEPPSVPQPTANGEIEQRPNVSMVRESVTQIEARAQFSANLNAVTTADEMTASLLDMSR